MGRLVTVVLFVCGLGLAGASAQATIVPRKDLTHLVGESAVIVVGTVTGVSYERDERSGEVRTEVRLERLKAVKGERHLNQAGGKGLILSFAGGLTEGGRLHVVVGMPELQLARTYLLFLRGGEWTLCPVTGWGQGVFEVVAHGDVQILLSATGQVVLGVRGEQLVLSTAVEEKLRPKAQGFDPDPRESSLRESRMDPKKLAEALKDSPYREDNVEELAREDERRVRELEEKSMEDCRPCAPTLRTLLGGEAMTLEALIATVREVDDRVRGQFDPSYREFNIKPAPLPPVNRQMAPPSVLPEERRQDHTCPR